MKNTTVLLLASLLSTAFATEMERPESMFRIDELARMYALVPDPDLNCHGQATPLTGKVLSKRAYWANGSLEATRGAMDSSELAQLGLRPSNWWKNTSGYRTRTFYAFSEDNLYFTFSLQQREQRTAVCLVTWLSKQP